MSEQEAAGESSADVYEEEGTPPDSGTGEGAAGTAVAESTVQEKPLFSDEELSQFDADDTQAGNAIGKMLSLFFLYTIIFTSIVAWWTFHSGS